MAVLNCCCTDGAQETGKLTLPSFDGSPAVCSCCAKAAGRSKEYAPTNSTMRMQVSRVMLASTERQTGRMCPIDGNVRTPHRDGQTVKRCGASAVRNGANRSSLFSWAYVKWSKRGLPQQP